MKPSLQEIVPGTFTPIYGYNGTFPGPTFISQRDRTACVRFVNRTGNITSVHYHGGHTPPDSDGVPMMSFGPTDIISPTPAVSGLAHQRLPERQPVPGDALVSRPRRGRHRLERLSRARRLLPADAEPVRGDAELRAVDAQLPSGYGRYDIPMVFQDRQFNADGSFAYNNFDHDGFIGDRFLVNGVIQPYLPVARRKYRFRWLNGSNARQYQFFLSTGDKFFVIGSDGGLLPQATEVREPAHGAVGALRGRDRLQPLPGRLARLPAQLPPADVGPRPGTDQHGFVHAARGVPRRARRGGPEHDPRRSESRRRAVHQRPPDRASGAARSRTSYLKLDRGNGAWQINERFYDPNRVDVVERLVDPFDLDAEQHQRRLVAPAPHPRRGIRDHLAQRPRAGAARSGAQGRVQPRAERYRYASRRTGPATRTSAGTCSIATTWSTRTCA